MFGLLKRVDMAAHECKYFCYLMHALIQLIIPHEFSEYLKSQSIHYNECLRNILRRTFDD